MFVAQITQRQVVSHLLDHRLKGQVFWVNDYERDTSSPADARLDVITSLLLLHIFLRGELRRFIVLLTIELKCGFAGVIPIQLHLLFGEWIHKKPG